MLLFNVCFVCHGKSDEKSMCKINNVQRGVCRLPFLVRNIFESEQKKEGQQSTVMPRLQVPALTVGLSRDDAAAFLGYFNRQDEVLFSLIAAS
jgi:hypothetical protein